MNNFELLSQGNLGNTQIIPVEKKIELQGSLPLIDFRIAPDNIYPEGFMRWRAEYIQDSEMLGVNLISREDESGIIRPDLTRPGWETLKQYTGERVVRAMEAKGADKIIVGISGDLDSSALVAIMAEFIRDQGLPYTIEAFYLKKDFQQPRFNRIMELINYLNRNTNRIEKDSGLLYADDVRRGNQNGQIVNFHVYDMYYPFNLFLDSLESHNGHFTNPSSDDALQAIESIIGATKDLATKLGKAGSSALIRAKKRLGITEGSELNVISNIVNGQKNSEVSRRSSIDSREESNLIHEVLVILRGHLARRNNSITLGGQQFSELAIENYTTADTLVEIIPFANLPKSILSAAFREYILKTDGEIDSNKWEARPMNYLVPFYPTNIDIIESEGLKIITRKPNSISDFVQVEVNTSTSRIPPEVWQEITSIPGENYSQIDGRIHWYIDPILHYFMFNGLTYQSVQDLIEQFPNHKTDIDFSALLMAQAIDKKGKKISSMLQTVTSDR